MSFTFKRGEAMTGRPPRGGFLAGTAVLALALAACAGPSPVASPPATATPAPTPAPTLVAETEGAHPAGEGDYTIGMSLEPGTYSSQVFDTPTQFSVPAGWKVFEDELDQFGLAIVANDGPCICFWRDVSLRSATCAFLPEPGVETTAEAIAQGLATRPGVAATEITPVTVGGLSGVQLDVILDPAYTGGCGTNPSYPEVPTLVGKAGPNGVVWSATSDSSQRLYLLNLDQATGGTNIAINIEVCCGVGFQQRMDAVTPVIESLVFGG